MNADVFTFFAGAIWFFNATGIRHNRQPNSDIQPVQLPRTGVDTEISYCAISVSILCVWVGNPYEEIVGITYKSIESLTLCVPMDFHSSHAVVVTRYAGWDPVPTMALPNAPCHEKYNHPHPLQRALGSTRIAQKTHTTHTKHSTEGIEVNNTHSTAKFSKVILLIQNCKVHSL